MFEENGHSAVNKEHVGACNTSHRWFTFMHRQLCCQQVEIQVYIRMLSQQPLTSTDRLKHLCSLMWEHIWQNRNRQETAKHMCLHLGEYRAFRQEREPPPVSLCFFYWLTFLITRRRGHPKFWGVTLSWEHRKNKSLPNEAWDQRSHMDIEKMKNLKGGLDRQTDNIWEVWR